MRRIGLNQLLTLAVLMVPLAAARAQTTRIFAVPPTRWDNAMSRDQPAQILGSSDLANLTGGIVFGLSPAEVNAKLTAPTPGVEWISLPFASEYPDEVRYFWVRFDAVRESPGASTACTGANSYIVFLFRDRGLFRISWRLLPDDTCASTRAAAEDIYARYLAIDGPAALASHYRAGKAEVVEVTDPNVHYLIPYRWANRQQR
ncbi:MAG TPA: hypothetical protein VHX39_22155 [Acetobacteraceae bacterium]|nr:hypothetical protein [Acetobacteraceae bacterium]